MSIQDALNTLLTAQTEMAKAFTLDGPLQAVVEDHRDDLWSCDHGMVWWKDKDGEYREARTHTHFFGYAEGLSWQLAFGNSNQNSRWLIFTEANCKSDFEYGDSSYGG